MRAVNKSSATYDDMDLSVNHRRTIDIEYSILTGHTQILRHPTLGSDGTITLEADSELFLI